MKVGWILRVKVGVIGEAVLPLIHKGLLSSPLNAEAALSFPKPNIGQTRL